MNMPAPFSKRQEEYMYHCFDSWFNVAEGGKRGGKNVLQTLIFCMLLEEHKNKIHLIAGVSVATAKLNILDCDGYGLLNYFEGRCREGKYTVIVSMCRPEQEKRWYWYPVVAKMVMKSSLRVIPMEWLI